MTAHIQATCATIALVAATWLGDPPRQASAVFAATTKPVSFPDHAQSVYFNGAVYAIGNMTGDWTSSELSYGTVLHADGDGPHACVFQGNGAMTIEHTLARGTEILLTPFGLSVYPGGVPVAVASAAEAPRPLLLIGVAVIAKLTYVGDCWKGEAWDANQSHFVNGCTGSPATQGCKLQIQYTVAEGGGYQCWLFDCGSSTEIFRDSGGVTIPNEPAPVDGPCPS